MYNILKQLLRIYYEEEKWDEKKLNEEEAVKYFLTLIANGNIVFEIKDGKIAGYAEFWLVDEDQLARKLKGKFDVQKENIQDGDICFMTSIWIDPKYRGNGVMKSIKHKIEDQHDFTFYAGEEHKNNKRFRLKRRYYG